MEEQEVIKQIMTELLEKMGFTNDVTVTQQENLWMVQISENDESPLLIGKFEMCIRDRWLKRAISVLERSNHFL